ncbi:hypothetical protein [Haloechinothrix salitolerans]|uniref:Cytochrome b561 bacterial/Ni-hydrogenase domain-containing protein n=1 Tax=Haloechinothrix salitolerans TaxID=926830 RepID=A0ABW2BVB5_9PSEU
MTTGVTPVPGANARDGRIRGWFRWMNTGGHKTMLMLFLIVVLSHWAEHIAQAIQIYLLGWPIPEARGVLGIPFPWLISSEWLHYAYAVVMLVGFIVLAPGFTGRSRTWWNVALGIQVWHHIEHLLLLGQAVLGVTIAGRAVPTSLVQLIVPRVELHLIYNSLVFVPMVMAMFHHRYPLRRERKHMACGCAVPVAPSTRPRPASAS